MRLIEEVFPDKSIRGFTLFLSLDSSQTVAPAGLWAPPARWLTVSTLSVRARGRPHTSQYRTSLTAVTRGPARVAVKSGCTSTHIKVGSQTKPATTTRLRIKVRSLFYIIISHLVCFR